jgi:hypothetical protein
MKKFRKTKPLKDCKVKEIYTLFQDVRDDSSFFLDKSRFDLIGKYYKGYSKYLDLTDGVFKRYHVFYSTRRKFITALKRLVPNIRKVSKSEREKFFGHYSEKEIYVKK